MIIDWSPRWTIKKLNYGNGQPMDYPWHVIPPFTQIPPRNVPHTQLLELYHKPGCTLARTQEAALAKMHEKIREAADG